MPGKATKDLNHGVIAVLGGLVGEDLMGDHRANRGLDSECAAGVD
jgi:hypothetical protein